MRRVLLALAISATLASADGEFAGGGANPRAAVVELPTWADSMLASWALDEGSGVRAVFGTCGTACALTGTNTPASDILYRQVSTAAANFAASSDQDLRCDLSTTCTPLNIASNLTYGAWARRTNTVVGRYWLNGADDSTAGGYGAGLQLSGTGKLECMVCDSGGTCGYQASAQTLASNDTAFYHHACVYTASGTSMQGFVNGASSGSALTSRTLAASNGARWTLSSAQATKDWDGQVDDAFVYPGIMAATSVCRICACGVSGENCACDPDVPTTYKACTTTAECGYGLCDSGACSGYRVASCGSCTLPDCNQAAP